MTAIRFKSIRILLTCFLTCLTITIGYSQFLGGQSDGHSNLRLSNVVCPVINSNPFLGGQSDGHSNLRLSNIVCPVINSNPFLGGQSDGHSNLRLSNIVCPVINSNPFLGGSSDGHSNLRLSNIVCPVINSNPFLGGQADGHSNLRLSNIVCPVINSNPFLGGQSDGHSNMRLANISRAQCISIVLPIELLTFIAYPVDKIVNIVWTTQTEINNDYFTVERSADALNFEPIATVKGAGNSSVQLSYSTADEKPLNGISYYRLKQTDFDGQFSHSKIVSVKFNSSASSFVIFTNPVPAGETPRLIFSSKETKNILVLVYDDNGREVYSKISVLQKGDGQVIAIDPSKTLSPGVYFISASSDNSLYRQKLIIK
ncbi:MAG: T9SS type A sorting domain-containing protein [Bacteroidia bacterium]|nr:T9SS type A sorting domain-containing protein [Bacteroidia bacterium]